MRQSLGMLVAAAALALGAALPCRAADADAPPEFAIQRATYEALDGAGGADVTEKVKALVQDGRLVLDAGNDALGGDPAQGHQKRLRVEYTLGGKALVAIVGEGGHLAIPALPPLTPKQQAARAVAVLKKSDATRKEKADACRQLAIVGTPDAVPILAALLGDEEMSHMARYALETMADASVDEALRDALGKLAGRPLVGVIGSIGVRHDAKAAPALAKRLGDAEADVADAAARSLGKIGTPEAAKALEGALGGAPAARQLALAEGLFRAAETLAAQAKRDDALRLYDRLRKLDGAHQVRTGALRGAILVRGKDGLPLLREALGSDDYPLVSAALRTSYEMPGAEVTAALAALLGKGSEDKQVLACLALGQRADAGALPALEAAAKAGPKAVRLAAVAAIARVGDTSSGPGLVALFADAEREVADAAREAFASLPGRPIDDAVMAMFASDNKEKRLAAMDLIARRRMKTAVPALLQAAADKDAAIRAAALGRVGELGGAAELPALLERLMKPADPKDLGPTEQAVTALCGRAEKPESCTPRLAALMPRAEAPQKCALVRILGTVGGADALKAVRAAAGDADRDVHAAAVRVLCGWQTADALPDVLALAQKAADPTEKALGLRAYLGWAGNDQVPQADRLAMCRQAADLVQKPDEKKRLLAALTKAPAPEALALAMPHVADAATRDEACAAAVSIAEQLLKGPDAAKVAAGLVEPLQKVAAAAGGEAANRAKAALEQARLKADGK